MHWTTCFALLVSSVVPAAASGLSGDEVPHVRSYFYVGGGYVDDGAGGHIFHNQMYVEGLSPVNGPNQTIPLVMIHGQAQTGTVSCQYAQNVLIESLRADELCRTS